MPVKPTILIYTHAFTRSIRQVVDWLLYWGKKVAINNTALGIKLFNNTFAQGGQIPVQSIWYNGFGTVSNGHGLPTALQANLTSDQYAINLFANQLQILNAKKILSNPVVSNSNTKLYNLYMAANAGLTIPATAIVATKQQLIDFVKKHRDVITKTLTDAQEIYNGSFTSTGYRCQLVTDAIITSMNDDFLPSLVQQKVEKQFEIRCFYLAGTIYSMAIFSQGNKNTALDFRNYNSVTPNRYVPFELPANITNKVTVLMDSLQLNIGSIDLIYNTVNEYVFLEVNETGEWGFVNNNCNYSIDQKIATYLNN